MNNDNATLSDLAPGFYWGRAISFGKHWAVYRLHEDRRITRYGTICHTWAAGDHPPIEWGPRIPDPPAPGGPD